MREMNAYTFASRLKRVINDVDKYYRYTFFLGAGCSKSSGIKTAGELVEEWLKKGYEEEKRWSQLGFNEWVLSKIPEYDDENLASIYGKVIDLIFESNSYRQKVIENIMQDKYPGFGYYVLAKLIDSDKYSRNFGVILTTNFDDLIEDAMYLYTKKKPLVILHESLASYGERRDNRPLVVKLHGDYSLSPKNNIEETDRLHKNYKLLLNKLFPDSGLVFVGYGGNDKSILRMLKEHSENLSNSPIYWVNDHLPNEEMLEWLEKMNFIWVKHLDFDELMLYFSKEFDINYSDDGRFTEFKNNFNKAFNNLEAIAVVKENKDEKEHLMEILQKINSRYGDYCKNVKSKVNGIKDKFYGNESENDEWQQDLQEDLNEAINLIYEEEEENFLDSAFFYRDYAQLMERSDEAKAIKFYKKAIEIDPCYWDCKCDYANLLSQKKELDEAEKLYREIVEVENPNHVYTLKCYADFLVIKREDLDEADKYYRRAISVPNTKYKEAHKGYADLLVKRGVDYAKAEEHYVKAIEADPLYFEALRDYASLVKNYLGTYPKAFAFYEKILDANTENSKLFINYALMLKKCMEDDDRAQEFYNMSLKIKRKTSIC